MKLVLASNSAGKLAELQALLAGLPLTLVSQRELGITEAAEPHITFIENALAKARHAAGASGGAAIADDSGLCVDALGGAPGVGSAHFADVADAAGVGAAAAGSHPATRAADAAGAAAARPLPADREALRRLQDGANNALLLARLHGVADRRAAFVCTLVAVRHAEDPEPLVTCGRWPGRVVEQPQGDGGFGYDPLLFIDELGQTVAQLDAAAKNLHSHRARAAAQMRALLARAWHLG